MRFSTIASAAAIAPALANAAYHADLKETLGYARIHNRCPYPVYLWSVKKDQGCSDGNMKKLNTGESYSEQYRDDHSEIGVSIKVSKTNRCKGTIANGENIDISQIEYHINHADEANFFYNFLDMSFVDCPGNTCPGRDAFCLKSGNNGDSRLATAGADKAVCPILSCSSVEECSTMAYVLPDDIQTKTCEPAADMDVYLCTPECGGEYEAPPSDSDSESDSEDEEEAEPTESTKEETKETPVLKNASGDDEFEVEAKVAAPAVTPAPEQPKAGSHKVKTEVVYVTEYKYVNEKRHPHAHAHGRRHF